MLSAGFELFANKANPVKIDSHGELFVFFLHFAVAGTFLRQRLMIHGKCEHDICTGFSGMKFAVETAKFNRVVAMKETMRIEKMVATIMVMAVSVTAIACIPNFFKLCECSRPPPVHALHEICVHFLAVPHALRFDLKCFVEQIISTGDEIDKVANGYRRVWSTIEMDMDTAGMIRKSASFT